MSERECRKARKRPIPFNCKLGAGHEGKCSPYTLPPATRYEDHFLAWDEDTQNTREITRQQMADSLMASAAQLGRGTPACGVLERQAAEIARGGTAGYTTVAMAREMGGAW